jgi:DNA gyrase/topoisomerase IV subunit B
MSFVSTAPVTIKKTVPVLDDKGHMVSTEVERDMEVDIAMKWGNGFETTQRSFVNIIATPKGWYTRSRFRACIDQGRQ